MMRWNGAAHWYHIRGSSATDKTAGSLPVASMLLNYWILRVLVVDSVSGRKRCAQNKAQLWSVSHCFLDRTFRKHCLKGLLTAYEHYLIGLSIPHATQAIAEKVCCYIPTCGRLKPVFMARDFYMLHLCYT